MHPVVLFVCMLGATNKNKNNRVSLSPADTWKPRGKENTKVAVKTCQEEKCSPRGSNYQVGDVKEDHVALLKEKDARDKGDSMKLRTLVSKAQGDLKTYVSPPDLTNPNTGVFRFKGVNRKSMATNRARDQFAKDYANGFDEIFIPVYANFTLKNQRARARRDAAHAHQPKRQCRVRVEKKEDDARARDAAHVHQAKRNPKRVRFERKEDVVLLEGVEKFGEGKWRRILDEYKDWFHEKRTNVNLKDRYRNLK
jgi:hypothetical protein